MLSDPVPPLVGKGLAVHEDQRGYLPEGNHGAGHHRFPDTGRGHQNALLNLVQRFDGPLLLRSKLNCAVKLLREPR
jgi:hypothetical protein